MGQRHGCSLGVEFVCGGVQVSVGAAPAYQQGVGIGVADDFLCGNVVGDTGHLLTTDVHHLFVVDGVGGDGAGSGILFQTPQAVLKTFGTGDGPVAHQAFGIAGVCAPRTLVNHIPGHVAGADFGILVRVGHAPCAGAVADERVRQQDDRCHVLYGNATCLEGHRKAVGGRCGCDDSHGALAVAAVQGLHQVGLLGLGGQACRGAATLYVDDDKGQFGDYGQADTFALESQTGSRSRGHGQVAGI